MHRVQMLAQEGTFVADILYYYGDHVPNVYPFKHSDMPGAMFGFDYDVTDENILMKLGVEDGDIVVPGVGDIKCWFYRITGYCRYLY